MRLVSTPHLPQGRVGLAALGRRYRARLGPAFEALGIEALWLPDAEGVDPRLAGHADLQLLHLGGKRLASACGADIDARLVAYGFDIIRAPAPGMEYPADCALNACIAGGRFFHRLDAASAAVVHELGGLRPVNIRQGYAKCCACVVDGRSIITSDPGITAAARAEGLDALLIRPGHIELEGFEYGFIGGASFKLSAGEMAFTGRMDLHPDWPEISHFLSEKGIISRFLTDLPSFDVGSVITLAERDRGETDC